MKGIRPVTIIGGGIAGLTVAAALTHQHHDNLSILEARGAEAYSGGAALAMAPNAMWVFRRLGLADKITAAGSRIDRYLFVSPQGRELKSLPLCRIAGGWNEAAWAIPRAHILDTLVDSIPADVLHLDVPVTGLRWHRDAFVLESPDGISRLGGIVVGADGIHSIVRDALWHLPPPQYQGFFAVRGIIDHTLPDEFQHTVFQVWGGAGEFGYSPLGKDRVYWFATIPWTTVQRPPEREHFLAHVRGWFDPVTEFVRETPDSELLIHPIYDRIQPFANRDLPATLVGDAAHLMTPNTGQGACQGIMDAWVLARELTHRVDTLEALAEYRRLRLGPALNVARRSRQLGQIIHRHFPFGPAVKQGMLKAAPASTVVKVMRQVVGSPDGLGEPPNPNSGQA